MPRVGTKIHLDRDARDDRREICNLWKNKIVEVCEERPETFGIRKTVAPPTGQRSRRGQRNRLTVP